MFYYILLKTFRYLTPSEMEVTFRCERKRYYSADFDPRKLKFLEETSKRNLTIIFLMVSNRPCQKPMKIVLRAYDMEYWGNTLNYLAKMVDLPAGIQR